MVYSMILNHDEEISKDQVKLIKAKMNELGYSDRQVTVIEVNHEEPLDFIVILKSL